MKFIKNTKHLIIILLTLIISIFIGYGISVAGWMDGITSFGDIGHGYRTNNSKSFEIKDLSYDKGAYGQGYKVTNTSGKDYFIPTKKESEWNSFKNNIPNNVVLSSIKKDINGTTKIYGKWNGKNWFTKLVFNNSKVKWDVQEILYNKVEQKYYTQEKTSSSYDWKNNFTMDLNWSSNGYSWIYRLEKSSNKVRLDYYRSWNNPKWVYGSWVNLDSGGTSKITDNFKLVVSGNKIYLDSKDDNQSGKVVFK